jgi:hypothetical protein
MCAGEQGNSAGCWLNLTKSSKLQAKSVLTVAVHIVAVRIKKVTSARVTRSQASLSASSFLLH